MVLDLVHICIEKAIIIEVVFEHLRSEAWPRTKQHKTLVLKVFDLVQQAAARDDEARALKRPKVLVERLGTLGSRVQALEGSQTPAAAQDLVLDGVAKRVPVLVLEPFTVLGVPRGQLVRGGGSAERVAGRVYLLLVRQASRAVLGQVVFEGVLAVAT
jgi:hypothetical protein